MLKNLKNKKKKGFTLIELIIVIAIIAILAAVAIPKFGAVRKNATLKSDIANAKTIANAVTALIAEGEITLPTNETVKSLTINNEKTTGGTVTEEDKVENYIQNVPSPKSQTGDFVAEVDKNGGVKVKANNYYFFPASSTDIK